MMALVRSRFQPWLRPSRNIARPTATISAKMGEPMKPSTLRRLSPLGSSVAPVVPAMMRARGMMISAMMVPTPGALRALESVLSWLVPKAANCSAVVGSMG